MGATWQEVVDRLEAPAWGSDPSGPWLGLILVVILLFLWKRIVAHLE